MLKLLYHSILSCPNVRNLARGIEKNPKSRWSEIILSTVRIFQQYFPHVIQITQAGLAELRPFGPCFKSSHSIVISILGSLNKTDLDKMQFSDTVNYFSLRDIRFRGFPISI